MANHSQITSTVATDGTITVLNVAQGIDAQNIFNPGLLGHDDLAIFTRIIRSDRAFEALLNTEMSRMLRAMRDAGAISYEDDKGAIKLTNIPKLSLSPMTAKPDECCVTPGDLQVCKNGALLKSLCLEKCENGQESMMHDLTKAAPTKNNLVYQAYLQLLKDSGVAQKTYPTIEEFEQLSLIAQFILLNILTFLNGMLSVERNGNIIRRFSGVAEIYANPDVYTVEGGSDLLSAFKEVACRMNVIGRGRFNKGFWLADSIAYSAIEAQVQPKTDGRYPAGWAVVQRTVTEGNNTYVENEYQFQGVRIIKSDLMYIDETDFAGNMYYIPETMGVFSAVPLDMPASFIQQEWEKAHSPFIHWDEGKTAAPDCWQSCVSLNNTGGVVATESNDLISITGINSGCEAKVFKGLEGLINVNSLAPYIK